MRLTVATLSFCRRRTIAGAVATRCLRSRSATADDRPQTVSSRSQPLVGEDYLASSVQPLRLDSPRLGVAETFGSARAWLYKR